jgi:hypothetical protein
VDRIGKDEDLVEDVVEGLHVRGPIAGDPRDRLVLRELEMEREEVKDVLLGPVRVGAGEELRDLCGVRGPACVVLREAVVVAGLGGRDEVDGDHDVLLEELRELVACSLTVVAGDSRTDVLLVLQEPARGDIRVGRTSDGGDDVLARPEDMVGPELSKREADRFFRVGHDRSPPVQRPVLSLIAPIFTG